MIQQFKTKWDKFISDWLQSPNETFKMDIWSSYNGKENYELLWEYLPQPYLGDPENCSVVTLNLNPGPVNLNPEPESNYRKYPNGKLIEQLKQSENYFEYAKSFPQIHIDIASKKFWNKQFKWVDSILEINEIKNEDRLPFAMEICPWHSKNWANNELEELHSHIDNAVFDVVDKVVMNAQVKIVLSVGKSYYDFFEKNGFIKKLELTPDNHRELNTIPWPENKHKEKSKRFFSVWKREKSDTIYFNTYSFGSNTPPSDKWNEIQKFILKSVK